MGCVLIWHALLSTVVLTRYVSYIYIHARWAERHNWVMFVRNSAGKILHFHLYLIKTCFNTTFKQNIWNSVSCAVFSFRILICRTLILNFYNWKYTIQIFVVILFIYYFTLTDFMGGSSWDSSSQTSTQRLWVLWKTQMGAALRMSPSGLPALPGAAILVGVRSCMIPGEGCLLALL